MFLYMNTKKHSIFIWRLNCITWKADNLLQALEALEAHSSLNVGCSRFILSEKKMDVNFQNCTSMPNRISNHKCIHCWPLGVHQQFWPSTGLLHKPFMTHHRWAHFIIDLKIIVIVLVGTESALLFSCLRTLFTVSIIFQAFVRGYKTCFIRTLMSTVEFINNI